MRINDSVGRPEARVRIKYIRKNEYAWDDGLKTQNLDFRIYSKAQSTKNQALSTKT